MKNISIIQDAIDHINDIDSIDDLYEKVDLEDPKVWKLISNKQTEGVFQIESNMMKGIIDIIKPDSFEDLNAINALG